MPLISQNKCADLSNNLAYVDIDCEFNKINFLIQILELCDKYIWQIVSHLSKLTHKLDYNLYTSTFYHILTFGSWYVSNSLFFLLYVVNMYFIEGQPILLTILYYLFVFLAFVFTISFSIFRR